MRKRCAGFCSKFELSELQSKLGDDSGVWLWEVCRGLDFTEGNAFSTFPLS